MKIIKNFSIMLMITIIIILGSCTHVLAVTEDEIIQALIDASNSSDGSFDSTMAGLINAAGELYVKEICASIVANTIESYSQEGLSLEGTTEDELTRKKEILEELISFAGIDRIATQANMTEEETQQLLDELIDEVDERIQYLEEQRNGGQDIEETPAFSGGSWVNPDSYNPGELSNAGTVINFGNSIIGIVQFVGTFASVIVLIILGIKYMLGSVEEKAEYKKTMWPYLIGAILVFATTTILSVIETITKQI